MVQVVGGNATVQFYSFNPEHVKIKADDKATCYSPSKDIAEFHTITFVLDKNIVSDVILPFELPNSTEFKLLPPANTGEPTLIPSQNDTKSIIDINKDLWNHALADSSVKTTF